MKSTSIEPASKRLTDVLSGKLHCTLEEILERIAADIGLTHISYVRFVAHSDTRLTDVITTYSNGWQERYSEKNYLEIDPIIAYGSTAVLPFDWDELKNDDPTIVAFFADAIANDVGRNGMSIPVRNRSGSFSLVSLTSDHSSEDWIEYKNRNIAKLNLMATHIDSAASFSRKNPTFVARLSETERECLNWFARGRNHNEIAESLGLTTSDVELYLDTARHKLSCININQAVAVAIATGAIAPESLK